MRNITLSTFFVVLLLVLVTLDTTLAQDLEWAKQAGGTNHEFGLGIAVDTSGNSYVTGGFRGSATFGAEEANETTLVADSFNTDIFVARYDGDGNLLWAKRAGGSNRDEGFGIAVDTSENSYVTGRFRGSPTFGAGEANQTTLTSAGSDDIFVAKYDGNGDLLWAKQAGGTDNEDVGFGIGVDGSGNSYVTGTFGDLATFGPGEANQTTLVTVAIAREFFVAKYDSYGDLVWAKQADGTGLFDQGQGIAVDAAGNSYVTGGFGGSTTFGAGEANQTTLVSVGSADIFAAKYDGNGDLVWAKQAGGTNSDQALSIAVDTSDNSYVTGFFAGSATFGEGEANETILNSVAGSTDFFVVKYDGDGDLLWAKQAGGTGFELGNGITVEGSGNSYATAGFQGSVTFGAGEVNETTLVTVGAHEIFVAKYHSNGDLVWAQQGAGGTGSDEAFGIAVDTSGNSYVTGVFFGSAPFGTGEANETTLTSAGSDDIFIAKYKVEPEARIEALIEDVEELLTGGILNGGQAKSLGSELENILKKLDEGNTTPAINQLGAFVNQVLALVNAGILTAEDGQDLVDVAQAVIDQLTE